MATALRRIGAASPSAVVSFCAILWLNTDSAIDGMATWECMGHRHVGVMAPLDACSSVRAFVGPQDSSGSDTVCSRSLREDLWALAPLTHWLSYRCFLLAVSVSG